MAPHPDFVALVHHLTKRDDAYKNLASAGAKAPQDMSGPGYQVLFAFIGVGMTMTAIWFFFWAKNGGFKWQKDDWEDYKSTVMRRKGPDGKTLSNATKSTILGGGSVVHGGSYGAPSSVGYTDETGTSADINEYRDAEEGKGGIRGGDGNHGRKKKRRDHTNDYNDPELRHYRNEKAARVGGLNRQADGTYTDYSGSQPSEIGSNVSAQPLVKKDKKDPKKEAKAKEQRARERMKRAKAAEKEAARIATLEAKENKAEAKREKDAAKKARKAKSVMSDNPEMAEVTRPLTGYTRASTEFTAPSEYVAPAPAPAPVQKQITGPRRAPPSAAYSFTTGDDTTVVSSAYTDGQTEARTEAGESSYYSDYRPKAEVPKYSDPNKHAPRSTSKPRTRPSGSRPASKTRPSSSSKTRTADAHPSSRPAGSRPPSKSRNRPSRSAYTAAPSDIFTTTNGDSQGHMSYPCHIPGLSQYAESVGVSESVSQVGGPRGRGRDVMDGYRRGGAAKGRRDSLSDSD
ncbi:hypothetical protein P153DRAFT_371100 [Dothidotthia symphoricarpi CBS 119687]|uniref:Uncharacterized protein n=1 Tax=Dothidotthia symphoricarpi CBS 119687 TaxID=1392245 RepID=A0A6A5ZYY0_9PLEO|nr:uncharacterized protein P153DRAFT_371100 [Dothidotthia symphoricarpi CBS 119687]KAF2124235.1 hypothetical protein P153DRAFT_371100 [Dothidotthia symphoricarpi CBS 119687]